MSQIKMPLDKGIIDQLIKLKINVKAGANKKIIVFIEVGNIVSLLNNFKPSAKGCNKPI
jgi:hypothetical protein